MGFVFNFFITVVFLSSAELFLLIKVAGKLGFMATFLLCVLTGLVGGAVIRAQGMDTLRNISNSLSRGVLPASEIVSGLMLIILGAFLMVPGFITDFLGFILLIRPVRDSAAKWLIHKFRNHVQVVSNIQEPQFHQGNGGANRHEQEVIEAEYTETDQ